MSLSLSHGRKLDVGEVGIAGRDLPALAATPTESRLDLRSWWPIERRAAPIELEIGSGKGTFLVQQAAEQPDVNFLGVEYAAAFWRYAADRCRRRNLPNVRLLHADAGPFITWQTPDAIFRKIHIYFPDPWPKKRHHKRRLIQAPFLLELHRTLLADGVVRIVTDHEDYFQWINEHAGRVNDRFVVEPFERPDSAGEGEVVGTNFERKYRREGRPFHAIALRRIGG